MITTKQRAYLRALANKVDPIFQIGKGGINEAMVESLNQALEARELIKINVLNNCLEEPKDLSNQLVKALRAEAVQVIGKKVVLYRASKENKKIELPK